MSASGTEPEKHELETTMTAGDIFTTHRVQRDESGVGHCWRTVRSADDTSADVVEEIDAAIRDGEVECDDYLASNGVHYRWTPLN